MTGTRNHVSIRTLILIHMGTALARVLARPGMTVTTRFQSP
jgi:hypothetical protein